MTEKFKVEEKPVQKKEEKKKVLPPFASDQTEIKRLEVRDVEEATKVMRKCGFDVTEQEISDIIKYGLSYGAYVDRMLVGVGFAWPVPFDEKENEIKKELSEGEAPNAIYNEESAVLLAYEGRGVRGMLLKRREEEGAALGFSYSLGYVFEDLQRKDITGYIKVVGAQLEKFYVSASYKICKTKKGVMAVKKLQLPIVK